MQGKVALVIFLFSVVLLGSTSAEDGKDIGSLYQCAHGLRGRVIVKNEREIKITGFNYDGKGPAAWFHGMLRGAKGVHSDGEEYVTLPYPNATCDRLKPGRSYTDEDVTVILPMSIKEFETIGVFCYQYCHNFGHIQIPADLNVPAAPADLIEVQKCPKPSYKACTTSTTRNGDIKPNCASGASDMMMEGAGSAQIIPAAVLASCSALLLVLSHLR